MRFICQHRRQSHKKQQHPANNKNPGTNKIKSRSKITVKNHLYYSELNSVDKGCILLLLSRCFGVVGWQRSKSKNKSKVKQSPESILITFVNILAIRNRLNNSLFYMSRSTMYFLFFKGYFYSLSFLSYFSFFFVLCCSWCDCDQHQISIKLFIFYFIFYFLKVLFTQLQGLRMFKNLSYLFSYLTFHCTISNPARKSFQFFFCLCLELYLFLIDFHKQF